MEIVTNSPVAICNSFQASKFFFKKKLINTLFIIRRLLKNRLSQQSIYRSRNSSRKLKWFSRVIIIAETPVPWFPGQCCIPDAVSHKHKCQNVGNVSECSSHESYTRGGWDCGTLEVDILSEESWEPPEWHFCPWAYRELICWWNVLIIYRCCSRNFDTIAVLRPLHLYSLSMSV